MNNDEWVEEMARLIRERDRSKTMIASWQRKLTEAEASIAYMRDPHEDGRAPEQEQAPGQEQVDGVQ